MNREIDDSASWRISILRSQNLHSLLHRRGGNSAGWRPLITLSIDPHLGHNHCVVHETTLGCDGQNPNSKTGLDIENPRSDTKLLFEVVHFPQAAKKKARRLNKTILGSCVYEMGELVRLAKDQEYSSKRGIFINLTASGSGPRARHMKRLRRDSTVSIHSDKGSPRLQIRLTPPKGTPFTLAGGPSKSTIDLGLSSCEEGDGFSESEDEETESLVLSLDSSKTLNDDEDDTSTTVTALKPEISTESGIRKRRRRVRRYTYKGYACDSGDEIEEEEKWISESASECASEEFNIQLAEDEDEDEDPDSGSPDPASSLGWSLWRDHVAPILGPLGMAQPNPGILPSYRDTLENNRKHQPNVAVETAMDLDETEMNTSPINEEDTGEWELEWWERVLCLFTVYRELRIAEYEESQLDNSSMELGLSQSPGVSSPGMSSSGSEGIHPLLRAGRYDKIYQRLQVEWTYVGGLLVGLAAIDAAIFAISPSSSSPSFSDIASGADAANIMSPSSLFPINSVAREVVSLSTISTALGLLCDAYLLMNYAWNDVGTFVNRARPPLSSSSSDFPPAASSPSSLPEQSTTTATTTTPSYSSSTSHSWGYFALSSRIPAICMVLSIIFIGVFLLIVASEAAPPAGLWLLGVFVGMGMWMQYVVKFGKVVGRGIRGIIWGVMNGALWVGSSVKGVGSKIRGLIVRSDDCDGNPAEQDVSAPMDVNTKKGKKSMARPLPAKTRPEGRGRHG
ncbi:hypothetical protein GGU10DRAFT_377787 [Lentinula aff. detonsa]|uniref:Uncharacterized protein n=1 Tax=Lentinula aff. detonsa TaxID=2804958 RepID=A0AA38L4D2_9AGAR|nr:hypothetical protein GGU10DRAFT_377787 [Lentinula aff. detonsa]